MMFDNIEKQRATARVAPTCYDVGMYGWTPAMYGLRYDVDFDVDFNILTALKGWVGHAPQGRGALHIINYY